METSRGRWEIPKQTGPRLKIRYWQEQHRHEEPLTRKNHCLCSTAFVCLVTGLWGNVNTNCTTEQLPSSKGSQTRESEVL